MKPNCAIIRWSEDSFAKLEWSDEVLRASEFELADPEDSYHELTYNQMLFAVYNSEDHSSIALMSFTIENDEGVELRRAAPKDMWEIISHLLDEHYADEVDE